MDQENLAPLIEFIGKKFDQVDQRFEAMDRRFEAMEVKIEEGHRHTGVLIEAVRDDVRQVAEGVANVDQRLDGVEQRLDRFEEKMEAGFTETRAAIPLFLRTGRPADSGARRQLRRFERAGGAPRGP